MYIFKLVSIIILLFIWGHTLPAQKFIVPYRVGDKFGLANEKGTILVQPVYDYMAPLEYNYFRYTKILVKEDSIYKFTRPGPAQRESRTYGLFYKDKLLIKDQPYDEYIIYTQLIIGSSNPYHAENCMLYNIKGKLLLPEKVKAIYVNDPRDVGNLATISENWSLLTINQRNLLNERTTSIAIYDHQKQQITGYLVKNATKYKLDKFVTGANFALCTYRDEEGLQEKWLQFKNNRFTAIDKHLLSKEELKQNTGGREIYDDAPPTPMAVPTEIGTGKIEDAVRDQGMATKEPNSPAPYYRKQNGNLIYWSNGTQEDIPLTAGMQLIFQDPQATSQTAPLLYKQQNRFGFIRRNTVEKTTYDSVIYWGNDFLAGIKNASGWQFGILDKSGNILLPIAYDSIRPALLAYQYEYSTINNKTQSTIKLASKYNYGKPTVAVAYTQYPEYFIQLYKNGKTGISSMQYEIILPVVYDRIAENGFNFISPRKSEYLIVQKNGLYGVQQMRYNQSAKKMELQQVTPNVFKNMPCFYHENYYSLHNLVLFGLYDQNFRFLGYADTKGFTYFKD